jgi:hypothetical protein
MRERKEKEAIKVDGFQVLCVYVFTSLRKNSERSFMKSSVYSFLRPRIKKKDEEKKKKKKDLISTKIFFILSLQSFYELDK